MSGLIAAGILFVCIGLPTAVVMLIAEWKRARDLQAIVDAHRHWCGGE